MLTWATRGGQERLPCHDFCFQRYLIKMWVAFTIDESLNDGLCSLPRLTWCQRVSDSEMLASQILVWKAGLQPVVIQWSFLADCTKLILFPFGCFCVYALPNSSSGYSQCLHCPPVWLTSTFCTIKCLASHLPQRLECWVAMLAF